MVSMEFYQPNRINNIQFCIPIGCPFVKINIHLLDSFPFLTNDYLMNIY